MDNPWNGRRWHLSFTLNFILPVKSKRIEVLYITFGLLMEKVQLKLWGRLKLLMLKCPIHELPNNIILNKFYARLSLHDKGLLDASCAGLFTRMKEEAKWDLLDRIQENTEAWENDKGRKSSINYDYECIKSFMGTNDLRDVSNEFGLDSQSIAKCFKGFSSYIEIQVEQVS